MTTPADTGVPGEAPRPRRRRPGLTTLILLGFVCGAIAGIVFGELMGSLQIVGRIFIALTQITVFPYIVIGLVRGVGGLDGATAKRLATRGVPILLAFWGLALAVFYVMPLAFPQRTMASFHDPNRFSGTAGEAGVDWVAYIPANPFRSLADGMVPAIVVFSLCVGIARSRAGACCVTCCTGWSEAQMNPNSGGKATTTTAAHTA